jgi:glutamine amidotransferase
MKMLKESGLDTVIPTLQQPVLGICLGMQLMCNSSEEGNTKGLGIFDVAIKKFSEKVKVPQMGWNVIYNLQSDLFKGIKEKEFMYLVHSFYAENCSEAIATTDYEIEYASALQKDNFYGVQFHPEKSSKAGEQILKNFLEL